MPILKTCWVYLFLSIVFMAGCQAGKKSSQTNGNTIFTHWIHSHEDDENEIKVFRPSTFEFPPSRGRMGLEMKSDGSYIEYRIGSNDVPVAVGGKYTISNQGKIYTLTPNDKSKKSRKFEVVSLSAEILKIRWIN